MMKAYLSFFRLVDIIMFWICIILVLISSCIEADEEVVCTSTNIEDGTCLNDDIQQKKQQQQQQQYVVPDECRIVMARSTINKGDSGWGVFTLYDGKRGQPIMDGDIVIQVPDLQQQNNNNQISDPGLKVALHDYCWDAEETGGFYEGIKVVSTIPGIGMLANGISGGYHNALMAVPEYDEAGITRVNSPNAGSISFYHNIKFYYQKNITAGTEILLNYGPNWFLERQNNLQGPTQQFRPERDIDWLRTNGRCLDNITPERSKINDAGRGIFATRDIEKGTIVAPVPVLPIRRQSLDITRQRDTETIHTKQLLLNYCFGHNQSSLLLYPYGPMVNYVNHGAGKYTNVRLQWSTASELYGPNKDPTIMFEQTVEELLLGRSLPNRTGILLELIATRHIEKGEEILLDYGRDWVDAWVRHIKNWKPIPGSDSYAPSYVQDDVVKVLRTERELRDYPYPDNVFTSCFYKYSDNKNEAETKQNNNNNNNKQSSGDVTAFKWKMTRGLFEPRNLRPCSVLKRHEEPGGQTTFTVQIRNRYGLSPEERIPKGIVHVVTHVPRNAIRFSDKIYTTDQHLENAFRHEIHIPDNIFPEKWKDLK